MSGSYCDVSIKTTVCSKYMERKISAGPDNLAGGGGTNDGQGSFFEFMMHWIRVLSSKPYFQLACLISQHVTNTFFPSRSIQNFNPYSAVSKVDVKASVNFPAQA